MGLDLTVKMDGYKTLANGTIKDEISIKVIRDVERTFSSFSGGEQGRLLFASILANRHMINKTHPYGGLDFLSIDEIFEGVDGVGLKSLIESAKVLDIAVMVITHVTDEEASSDVLTIVKENGISTIKK
jgi:DNA repair exonuclease SbcCD ATPase subunit